MDSVVPDAGALLHLLTDKQLLFDGDRFIWYATGGLDDVGFVFYDRVQRRMCEISGSAAWDETKPWLTDPDNWWLDTELPAPYWVIHYYRRRPPMKESAFVQSKTVSGYYKRYRLYRQDAGLCFKHAFTEHDAPRSWVPAVARWIRETT